MGLIADLEPESGILLEWLANQRSLSLFNQGLLSSVVRHSSCSGSEWGAKSVNVIKERRAKSDQLFNSLFCLQRCNDLRSGWYGAWHEEESFMTSPGRKGVLSLPEPPEIPWHPLVGCSKDGQPVHIQSPGLMVDDGVLASWLAG